MQRAAGRKYPCAIVKAQALFFEGRSPEVRLSDEVIFRWTGVRSSNSLGPANGQVAFISRLQRRGRSREGCFQPPSDVHSKLRSASSASCQSALARVASVSARASRRYRSARLFGFAWQEAFNVRDRIWQRGIDESNVMARVNYRAAARCERKPGSTFPTAVTRATLPRHWRPPSHLSTRHQSRGRREHSHLTTSRSKSSCCP